MKSLITGTAGFIGLNLLDELIKKEYQIVGIDKNFDRKKYFKKYLYKNAPMFLYDSNLLKNNIRIIWDDIKNITSYSYNLDNIDIVYHLAAASDIKRSLEDPTWDLIHNVNRTHQILETMRKKDIDKIVFTSTSVVHGTDAPIPTPEEGIDFRPISQYAASKIACEVFIHAYSHVYGIKGWIFRLGNVIGKYQHRGVIFDFLKKLKDNQNKLEILGDGEQIKSYIHVSDVVNALTYIPEHDNNKNVEVYNLATYDYKNVRNLADIVCEELKVSPRYKFTGGDHGWVGDVPQVVLSIDKALSTGWKPKLNCEEAIRRAVNELSKL